MSFLLMIVRNISCRTGGIGGGAVYFVFVPANAERGISTKLGRFRINGVIRASRAPLAPQVYFYRMATLNYPTL